MMKDLSNTTISCTQFNKYLEMLISKHNSIKNSVRPIEKSIFAEEVCNIADRMLQCALFDKLQLDCNNCHATAKAHKKHAEVYFDVRKSA